MKLPKIIYQTNQRWLIVYKPRDWSLGSRAISKLGSIESFLAPLLRGSTKLYFPFELGTQMSGLGLACCDRGMQSQFERFRARDEMELKFRIHAPGFRNEGREPEDMTLRMDAITESEDIEIKASEYVSNRRVRNLLKVTGGSTQDPTTAPAVVPDSGVEQAPLLTQDITEDDFLMVDLDDGIILPPSPERRLDDKDHRNHAIQDEVMVYVSKKGKTFMFDGEQVTHMDGSALLRESYFGSPRSNSKAAIPWDDLEALETQSSANSVDIDESASSNIDSQNLDSYAIETSTVNSEPEPAGLSASLLQDNAVTLPEMHQEVEVTVGETPERGEDSEEPGLQSDETTMPSPSPTTAPITLSPEALEYLREIRSARYFTGSGLARRSVGIPIAYPFVPQRLVQTDDQDVDGAYYVARDDTAARALPQIGAGLLPNLFLMRQISLTTSSPSGFVL